jgi:hypothetical protein
MRKGVMWDRTSIVHLAAEALRLHAAALDEEDAVRGIDALNETALHPILAAGFAGAGFGVFREIPFPETPRRRATKGKQPAKPRRGTLAAPGETREAVSPPSVPDRLAHDAERERCDLVITVDPAAPPRDPMRRERRHEREAATLFAGVLPEQRDAGAPADECLWLEVKAVGQFEYHSGVPGPNRAYAGTLVSGVRKDLTKLARVETIRWSGAMTLLFAADERTAEHDWLVALDRALHRGTPLRGHERALLRIADRIGNSVCLVGLAYP